MSDNTSTNCKGCFRSKQLTKGQIQKLVKEQLEYEIDIISEETYKKRLEICENCTFLSNETTCLHCGCFVEFRARLAYKKCPHPSGSKW
ncbi:MAG: DUF6171 family protein [Bacillota bacterium]